ncbi:MAG: hypothetical protein HOA17_05265 [Candidatus Melainabacteria bacterium]|jgi:hypothetical protein|nr:hypothetical protein [Candidatus Melainabacteria bacterium]
MPRAAVLVQGVNSANYIKEALLEGGLDLHDYDKILEPDTEEIFDRHIFSKLGFWDWAGDVIQFYNNLSRRQAACRLVRESILELQAQGYDVDIIAHSLGCQIALCCAPQNKESMLIVNKVVFMGSPMGIIFIPMAWRILSHAKRYSKNFKTRSLDYLWSKNDWMCRSFNRRIQKVIDQVTSIPEPIESTSKHEVQEYTRDYMKQSKSIIAMH